MVKRNWAKDRVRQQIARGAREARACDAYVAELQEARRNRPAPPSKAQLRQEGEAIMRVLANRPIGRPWSPWVEVGPGEVAPMTGQPYTATIEGRMWSRER